MTTTLCSENERWWENVSVLRHNTNLLTCDVLLASAFISYIGPFPKLFHCHLMDELFSLFLINRFQKSCNDDRFISISDISNPLKILITKAEMAQWNADFLPANTSSTENGSMLCNTPRWPLIVDPQLQGVG